MKLHDTCSCGATFEVRSLNAAAAAKVWAGWINAHAPCRGDNRVMEVETG